MKRTWIFTLFVVLLACDSKQSKLGEETVQRGHSSDEPSAESAERSFSQSLQKGDSFRFSNRDFVVEEGEFQQSEDSLFGSGVIVSLQHARSITSNLHFAFSAELMDESSSVNFFSFATEDLSEEISFRVSAGEILISGPQAEELLSRSLDLQFSYSLDIHNKEDPTHVIFWDGLEAGRGGVPRVWDSTLEGVRLGAADGLYYGFILEDARLLYFSVEPPKAPHP